MIKIENIKEFNDLQARVITDKSMAVPTLVFSAGTCGQASGINDLMRVSKRYILEHNIV
ncbi:hypothetical protein KKA47_00375 [bacterium]|nr:hypothetical protein [bacterium]